MVDINVDEVNERGTRIYTTAHAEALDNEIWNLRTPVSRTLLLLERSNTVLLVTCSDEILFLRLCIVYYVRTTYDALATICKAATTTTSRE